MDFRRLLLIFLNIVLIPGVIGINSQTPFSNFTTKLQRKKVSLSATLSKIEDHPYAVQIYAHDLLYDVTAKGTTIKKIQINEWNFKCTGAIIAPQLVFTAAVCVHQRKYYGVNAGEEVTNTFQNWNIVVNKRVHPLYSKGTPDFNLAILKLERPYVYTAKINQISICYTTDYEYRAEIGNVVTGTVAGWGMLRQSDETFRNLTSLQEVKQTILPMDVCLEEADLPPGARICSIFCATQSVEEDKYCTSDNGALFIVDKYLAGIVSWYPYLCLGAGYYFHTKFSYYGIAHWIYVTQKEILSAKAAISDLNYPNPNFYQ